MFNSFESGDEHKRKAKEEARLDLLKRAYESGYFKEEGSESVVMAGTHELADAAIRTGEISGDELILVFDGRGPDDRCGQDEERLQRWSRQAIRRGDWPNTQTGRVYRSGDNDCPTCGRPRAMFVNGDCPGCNPPVGDERLEPECVVCAGTRVLYNGNTCPWCARRGEEPA